MRLPSNVGTYDSVPLVAFDFLEPRYLQLDNSRKRRAWSKVAEVERRLDEYEWLVHVARQPRGVETFVLDLATAYLLSFESAFQLLNDECFATNREFEAWLKANEANDFTVRGLRTLRHLEAHIRAGNMSQRAIGGHSRFSGGEGGSNIGWRWAQITEQEYRRLRSPKISFEELAAWNEHSDENLAMDLMRDGLSHLIQIIRSAEALAPLDPSVAA